MKYIEIDGKTYQALAPEYFDTEEQAEAEGYYWDDTVGYWTKEEVN